MTLSRSSSLTNIATLLLCVSLSWDDTPCAYQVREFARQISTAAGRDHSPVNREKRTVGSRASRNASVIMLPFRTAKRSTENGRTRSRTTRLPRGGNRRVGQDGRLHPRGRGRVPDH